MTRKTISRLFVGAGLLCAAACLWLWPDKAAEPSGAGEAATSTEASVATTAVPAVTQPATVSRAPAHPVAPHKAMVAPANARSDGLLDYVLHSELPLAYRTELIQYLPEVLPAQTAREITAFLAADAHFSRQAEDSQQVNQGRYLHLANDLMGKLLHADLSLDERHTFFSGYAADEDKGYGPRIYALQHLALLSDQTEPKQQATITREVAAYADTDTPMAATALVLLQRLSEAHPDAYETTETDLQNLLHNALTSTQPATRLTAQSLSQSHSNE